MANSSRMKVNSPVYVAGFDRGVRPIGDWSISITLSISSIPSIFVPARLVLCAVQLSRERPVEDVVDQCGLARSAHAGHGSEDTQGYPNVDVLEIVARAPRMTSSPLRSGRRVAGVGMVRSPLRYAPVNEPVPSPISRSGVP